MDDRNEGEKSMSNENMQAELSDTWLELLGMSTRPAQEAAEGQERMPLLANDPWSELLRLQSIQVVDLQQVSANPAHTPLQEGDVEQVLDVMQEKPGTTVDEKNL